VAADVRPFIYHDDMQRLIALLIVAALGWYGYTKYQGRVKGQPSVEAAASHTSVRQAAPSESQTASPFKCDGRIYCSQMTSCAEATFYLKNCPGTKMDGNNDGIPCEKQWCK
jgi:predicted negative regulator of RcsB-dependent stress response